MPARANAAVTVLTAVVGPREAPLVSSLERSRSGIQVVRRCADLGELMSAAEAGLARAVILSADLQRLDRATVGRLTALGIAVVGLAPPADTAAVGRLTDLGVAHVLAADTASDRIAATVTAAVAELTDRRGDIDHARIDRADPGAALPPMPSGRRASGSGQPAPTGRVVTVWGPAGAPGRTTVAVNVAAELATVSDVLLVDADTYGATVAQALGLLDESAGLAAAARAANHGDLNPGRLAGLAPPVTERLRVLTGLPQSRRWPELRPAALDVVWRLARCLAPWTIIDTGFSLETDEELMFDTSAPRRNGATLSALATADMVLAVGSGDPIGLQRIIAGLNDLAEVVPEGTPVTVVVNKIRDSAVGRSADQLVRGALERFAGVTQAVLVPDDREALDAAMLAGRSLVEQVPASPARHALSELAWQLSAAAGDPGGRPEAEARRRGLLGRRGGRSARGADNGTRQAAGA
jgi:MinD-like ATPase involved in chromosome partitioning or flagellar assembly